MARRTWTLALTSVAFFMVALDSLVVVTALPAIHREIGGSISTLEWTVNAFTLTYAAGIITAAALGDRLGRRLMFILGLAVFTASSVACAIAPSAELLIAARAVQGLGAAMVMPVSLTILTTAFPAERRGTIVGIWGGIGGLAVATGPLVGGAITQGLSWHWIFWVNAPIGALAILLSLLRLEESKGPATRLDLIATALVASGAAAIVWGLIRAGDEGWQASSTVGTLIAGVLLVAGFVAWELRATEPMLPMHLFRSVSFSTGNATAFLMSGTIFAAAFLVAQYMQFGLGYSPLGTGLRLLPWTATPLFVAPAAGFLSDRVGRRPLLVLGMAMQGVGLAWFALLATAHVAYGELVVPLIVAGVGVSLALPIAPTVVVSAVEPHEMGKASGVNSTMQRFGAAFAIAIGAAVFASNGHIASPATFVSGFQPALIVVASLSLLGSITALGVQLKRPAVAQASAVAGVKAA
ncbi:MAG TPA: DHA2 family efflux MFS transporter permease subunit [Candidatus Dormibacteraeota bacterium]|nr:DHA2 family efflux MFS transporter permease subunit [Candidatus Dormibacteraeota bacterium]